MGTKGAESAVNPKLKVRVNKSIFFFLCFFLFFFLSFLLADSVCSSLVHYKLHASSLPGSVSSSFFFLSQAASSPLISKLQYYIIILKYMQHRSLFNSIELEVCKEKTDYLLSRKITTRLFPLSWARSVFS